MTCPLCGDDDCRELHRDKGRRFFSCAACTLIFVPPVDHLGPDDERRRYALHDNTFGHEGYVRYLGEIVQVVNDRLLTGDILDFGSGPEAVLARLFTGRGYRCRAYDPLYGIGADALDATYDCVILSEVIEHVRDLSGEISLLKKVTRPAGRIVIRTKIYPSIDDFPGWWYKNDGTHINFFSRSAMEFLAGRLGRSVETVAPDIFALQPQMSTADASSTPQGGDRNRPDGLIEGNDLLSPV
jgi:hypothetical protein